MWSGSPRWSPNGQKLAFDAVVDGNFEILIVAANGGQPQRLAPNPANDSQPSWSRDGKSIYFASSRTGRDEVWRVPESGGDAVQVTRNGGFTAFESANGQALYYSKGDTDTKLWRCNLDGSGETVVLDDVGYRAFVVTADRIYFTRPGPGEARTLWVLHLRTGRQAQIAVVSNFGRLGLSVSPDNQYLIYPRFDREGSDLMLVPDFR